MKSLLQNKILTATIDHHGAELVSLRDASGRDYIWEGDPAFWGKHSPILFPIVGTLKDGRYEANGDTYLLARHGFAREREFRLETYSENRATFLLQSDADSLAVYPFPFELRLNYRLEGASLTIGYEVHNTGAGTMWFSIGGHPAFALPDDFTSYELEANPPGRLEYHLLDHDLLSDETRPLDGTSPIALDYGLFANDALVFKRPRTRKWTLRQNGKAFLEVDCSDFPSLGLWTKAGAPFLCIEPWFGYADTVTASGHLSEKEGIQRLEPGDVFSASFHITILTP